MTSEIAPWILNRPKSSYRMGDWVEEAACAQIDPELFFPNKGQSGARAKIVCRSCPVVNDCFEWAVNAPFSIEGIWGGTSERDRMEYRSRRGIKTLGVDDDGDEKCGTEAGAKRHYRANQIPCPACRRAGAIARRERELRKKAAQ